jgi:hypothetical protein
MRDIVQQAAEILLEMLAKMEEYKLRNEIKLRK